MKKFNNRGIVPFLCSGILGIFFLGSCTQNEAVPEYISGNLVITGNYQSAVSRNYWEEDAGVVSGLKFFWENSVDGNENLSVSIADGSGFYNYGNSSRCFTMAKVEKTSNPLVSQITLKEEIGSSYQLQPGNEIYSYVPVVKDESIIASHLTLLVTMFIPDGVNSTALNSTVHLSPYMYMAGKGIINAENDFLTSKIYYSMLPAILRFKIINLNKTETFIPTGIYMEGDISTLATIRVNKSGDSGSGESQDIVYSLGDKIGVNLSDVSVGAGSSGNTYALAFPTDFAGKKLFFRLTGMYNGEKVERVAYLDVSVIPDSQFKSNYCYTFNLKIDERDFKIGGVDCGQWTGSEENLTSTTK